ncbi:MAG: di-trans,poly-cis-decaprenylcistransferase [Acidobacteria bacterium]|nr:di-trans,poly-cis-decaprenylcistransferase [Acidobacteriota bacterium]
MSRNFATQSTCHHVAIVMDGNGRWADERGLPRLEGHRAGAVAVRRATEAAARLGVPLLTLYAFSSDNWRRPEDEVRGLFALFTVYLREERERALREGVRVSVIGRRDRLAPRLVREIERTEETTRGGTRLHLRIAIDYSARDLLVAAASDVPRSRDEMSRAIARAMHAEASTEDVDLFIRTGRERRLSDFLLWECAYAELVFYDRMWPDFSAEDLEEALRAFERRQRRFGKTPAQTAEVAR